MALTTEERMAGLGLSSAHLVQHLYFRLLPPLIPVLVVAFEVPLWQLGLLVSAYTFAGGLSQAPMGVLADRIDRAMLLKLSLVLMPGGYVIFALSEWLGQGIPATPLGGYEFSGAFLVMTAGMLVSGIGHGVIHPVGYPLITSNVRPEHKGFLLGIWGSASKFGDALAPLLVGAMILLLTWSQILLFIGVAGLLYAALVWTWLDRSSLDTRPPPASPTGDASPLSDDPRTYLVPLFVVLLFFMSVMFATTGLITFMPVFVAETYPFRVDLFGTTLLPESIANLYFASFLIGGGLSQLITGKWTDRHDHRSVIILLLAVASIALLGLSFVTLHPLGLLLIAVLLGASLFGLNPSRDALISDIATDQFEGRTFGYFWTTVLIVSSAYPVLIGYVADTRGIGASFEFLAIGTVLACGIVALLYSRRIYRPRATADFESAAT